MDIYQAYREMESGKKITRPNFTGYWFLDPETGKLIVHTCERKGTKFKDIKYGDLHVLFKNCLAKDWKIYEEGNDK